MCLHRAETHHQGVGDLPIRFTLRHQRGDGTLFGRQAAKALFGSLSRGGCWKKGSRLVEKSSARIGIGDFGLDLRENIASRGIGQIGFIAAILAAKDMARAPGATATRAAAPRRR